MKRLGSFTLMFLIALPAFAVFTPKARASENVIFQDDFESYAVGTFPSSGGWKLIYNGAGNQYQVITTDQAASGTKSLQMEGRNTWSAVVAKDFSSSSNLIGFEAHLMGTPGSGPSVGFGNETIKPWGRMYGAVCINTTEGYIYAGSQKLQPCTANTWYKIREVMDRNARTFDVWIDDQLKGSNIPEPNNPWEIQSLRFDVGWPQVLNYYDDVQVFEQTSSTFKVTFTESGLRLLSTLTTWSVTIKFNGVPDTIGSSSDSIIFPNVPDGIYFFSVSYVEGYAASPTSDMIEVKGADKEEQITFTPISLEGISTTITGAASLVPNSSFTLQQNFYLFTGNNDTQGHPIVYWCQNVVSIDTTFGSEWRASSVFWLWNCNYSADNAITRSSTFDSIGFFEYTYLPLTMTFTSWIGASGLWMSNSIHPSGWESEKLVLTSNAYITSEFFGTGIYDKIAPEFVIVGPSPGGNVKFTFGQGTISCKIEICGTWDTALDLGVVGKGEGGSTGETSEGLAMSKNSQGQLSGGFGYQAGAQDQGIFFGFDINGKPAKTLTMNVECPVYLDLYDGQGNWVGYNATSGTVENQVDNALWESNQTILVFDPSGTYYLEVTGTENGTYELKTSWQDVTGVTSVISDLNGTITKNETQTYTIGANANVTLTGILPSKTVVGQGLEMQVNAMVANLGGPDATFNVTLYANDTVIGTQNLLNLSGWNSTNVCFMWNATRARFAKGNYVLSARVCYAWPIPGETNTANNLYVASLPVYVAMVGDITGPKGVPDGRVDMYDVALFAESFGSTPGSPRWNPNCDLTGPKGVPDGHVKMDDIAIVASHFGKHDP